MPSPFPGMDPYLEGSEWGSVHVELSSEITRQLAPRLRPKYVARAMRRFVMDTPDNAAIAASDVYPDVGVAARHRAVREIVAGAPPTPVELPTVVPTRVPQVTIEIRDVANRKLVTAIEVLSPANKRGQGYGEYVEKRQKLLLSTTHLLEIDLLRAGRRVPMQKPLPVAPYFVFLSRAERRPLTEVWAIQLNMRLPIVPVPLLPGDAEVVLDLQAALSTLYDTLGYDLSVDYTCPPEAPLEGEMAAWADSQIRNWLAAHRELHPSSPLDLKT